MLKEKLKLQGMRNHYFENDKPVETPEGKRNRQIREAESNQLTLFDYDNN